MSALAVGDAILDIVTPPLPVGAAGDRQSRVESLSFLPGGNATNFALAARALGADVTLVACVGRDWAGDFLLQAMRRSHLRARIRRVAEPTGMTVADTRSNGTRHLITAPGANTSLKPSDVPASLVRAADHVHRAGFWWTSGLIGEPSRRLLRAARRAGARTSLDVATDPEGWPENRRDLVRDVLPEVDVFFGNDSEVTAVADASSVEEAADRLRSMGVREVVVHQGERGASAFTSTEVVFERALPVLARNPTGCGDVFNAAYVVALERNMAVPDRLRFANAAAALHLERPGVPYPTATDVARVMRTGMAGRGAPGPPSRARVRPHGRAPAASRRTRRRG